MWFRDAESLAHCHEGSHHQSQDLKQGLVLWETHTYLTPRCYLHIGILGTSYFLEFIFMKYILQSLTQKIISYQLLNAY